MRRLLIAAGALACMALHAQDKEQKAEDRSQKSEELLKKPQFSLPRTLQSNAPRSLIVKEDSWNCVVPMPGAKAVNVDPDMAVPPAERSYGMPVVAPPPMCGQQSANTSKK